MNRPPLARSPAGSAPLALALVVTVALALAWVLLRPTNYTARAPVLVDVRAQDPLAQPTYVGVIPPSYMATQIDVARSERVAERVVDMLGLEKDEQALADWRKATRGGKGSAKSWLAGQLQAGLEVKPARESNIINITYTDKDPQNAAKVANAFAQAYIDTGVELKTDPAKKYATFFDDQLKSAREKLEAAQERLTQYQQKNGVTSADERVDYEMARLNELSSQLTLVQSQNTDAHHKRVAPRESVAEVMSSPLINNLKADISRLEAKIQESNANLGPRHPAMVRMNDELGALRSRLAQETSRIGSSIETSYVVGKARESELSGAVQAQRARVMALNKHRDELSLLRRDVDTVREESRKLLAENQRLVAEGRAQAEEILAEARRVGEAQRQRTIEEAHADLERRLEENRKAIEAENQRLVEQIRREVIELTLVASEKVTGKVLDQDDQRRLIDEAVDEIDFDKLASRN